MFEFHADAEARLGFDGADEIGFVAAEMVQRQIEHGEFKRGRRCPPPTA